MSSVPCIDRIPPELLCQIFAATLPPAEDPDISPDTGAYLLSQVSQKWRHVAITDPRLWAAFKVALRPSTSPTHTEAVKLFLTRSASQPLSISLVAPDQFKQLDPNTRKLATSVIHLLAKHASRWSRLSLVLPSSSTLFAALSIFPAPELTRLSLDLGNWTYEEASNINNLLMRAPALQHFSWSNRASWGSWDAAFDTGVEKLRAPWHPLTNVLLDTHVTFKVALAVLRQCHSVVVLELPHFSAGRDQITTILSEDDPLKTRIHLPHLERLTIFQHTLDDGLSAFLGTLSCPQLRHFNFTAGFIDQVEWPQSSFSAFLARSSCSLESLILESPGITEEQLIKCLQHNTSSLKTLEVYSYQGHVCVGDRLLGMLLCKMSVFGKCATLCPKLGTLTLENVTECTNGALAAVLRSRTPHSIEKHTCSPCKPLQHIDIHFQKKYHARNVSDLDYLRRQDRLGAR